MAGPAYPAAAQMRVKARANDLMARRSFRIGIEIRKLV
jgi:hypothetical protein